MARLMSRASIGWELSRIRRAMMTLMQRRDEARAIAAQSGDAAALAYLEKCVTDALVDAGVIVTKGDVA